MDATRDEFNDERRGLAGRPTYEELVEENRRLKDENQRLHLVNQRLEVRVAELERLVES